MIVLTTNDIRAYDMTIATILIRIVVIDMSDMTMYDDPGPDRLNSSCDIS